MNHHLISQILLSAFTGGYIYLWLRCYRRGVIDFAQGRGTLRHEGARFRGWLFYHGTLAAIFMAATAFMWFKSP